MLTVNLRRIVLLRNVRIERYDSNVGAIGSYKNHRHVAIEAPEAVEMTMLTSDLLRLVVSRTLRTQDTLRSLT
jgi:hypothetical protein